MPPALQNWPDLLVKQGIISRDELEDAERVSRSSKRPLDEVLLREGVEGKDIAKAKAKHFRMPFVDLEGRDIPPSIFELIQVSKSREANVIAYDDDGEQVHVAIGDPLALDVIDELRFLLQRPIQVSLGDPAVIHSKIESILNKQAEQRSRDAIMSDLTDSNIAGGIEEMDNEEEVTEDSAPVVRMVDKMIKEAVKQRASDIHVEPFEDRVRVRYRIDGVLHERSTAPRKLLNAILSRIKILGRIDIAERRRPQDGRIKLTFGPKELDLRVSVLPSSHGQSVVMRILDKDNIKVSLRDMGFAEEDFEIFSQSIRRPNGIILVTGPTGSGKTTTLYAALNDLNRPDRKIITAEDPVEYYLTGINQVEVRHSIGLDFARIIKSMLRQAPNVILVGEIRDRETAEMAIQASLTGHLVFSTLHTNDAPGAITRMVDIGVPPYLVASSVITVMAQRLVRRICQECKQPFRPSDTVLEQAGIPPKVAERANFMKGKGCAKCNRSGYRGRLAIFELMAINSKIRELAFKGASTQEIRKAAVANGMKTLYKDGIIKALKGFTTLEEVFRVAGKKG